MIETLTVITKALAYGSGLLAAGQAFCLWAVPGLPASECSTMRRQVGWLAPLALALAWALLALQAVFLAGGRWQAAVDFELWAFVLEGPIGLSLGVETVGLILLTGLLWPGRVGAAIGLTGALVYCLAYALSGHVAVTASVWHQALLVVHMVCLVFWLGIFPPLYRLAGRQPRIAGGVAEAFGRRAVAGVGLLVVAGAVTLTGLVGNPLAALDSDYGRLFAVKLGLFALVVTAAAINKLVLSPALSRGETSAGRRMRRSLVLEGTLIGGIIVVTSIFTTLTGPG